MNWLQKLSQHIDFWDITPEMIRVEMVRMGYEDSDAFNSNLEFWVDQEYEEEDAKEKVWEETLNTFDSNYNAIAYEIQDNRRLRIYREVTATNIESIKLDPVGIYWSWEESVAEAHWGAYQAGYREYLIVGEVDIDNVNWIETMYANSDLSSAEEREIRLILGSPVDVIEIREQPTFGYEPTGERIENPGQAKAMPVEPFKRSLPYA